MSDTIALIGLSGAGKSTIGPLLAARLGVRFVDVDAEVAAEHGPIAVLFAEHGEAHFRTLERDATVAALARPGVVSLGGGAPLTPAVAEALGGVRVVWLEVSAEDAAGRIGHDPGRPLLGGAEAGARLRTLLGERRPTYERLADHRVPTAGRTPAELVDLIVREIEEVP